MGMPPKKNAAKLDGLLLDYKNEVFCNRVAVGFTDI
jgi:hypothetical protein